MNCISSHEGQSIKLLCFTELCRSSPLVCEICTIDHDGHSTISISKFSTSLQRHIKRLKIMKGEAKIESDIKQEQQQESYAINAQMRTDLECAAQHIYKLKQKLTKYSQLLEGMYDLMTKQEEIGEEQDAVHNLIQILDASQDIIVLNKQFSNMFLLTQAVRMPDADSGKMELSLTPSQICLIRTQSVLDRMYEFSMQLKDAILKQEDTFTQFISRAGSVLEQNKQFISKSFKPHQLTQSSQQAQLEEQIITKDEQTGILLTLMSSTHEDILVRELSGIERCDTLEKFPGSKKQMIKLCNYWIFYNSPICSGIFPEPQGQELTVVKGRKINPPIRCAFCRLVKQKEFLINYYRYDPAKRCGALCQFKDDQDREICVHEMCLIWSNRIMLNLESQDVEFNTIVMAVQYAKSQKCRFCGYLGASLKCNRPECNVHFHFHCLKHVRLMGMQLDFDARFRFYCEDHVIRTTQFQSDWFITRIRMMHIIQAENRLLPPIMNRQDFTIDTFTQNSNLEMEESSYILPLSKKLKKSQ